MFLTTSLCEVLAILNHIRLSAISIDRPDEFNILIWNDRKKQSECGYKIIFDSSKGYTAVGLIA